MTQERETEILEKFFGDISIEEFEKWVDEQPDKAEILQITGALL